MCDVVISALLLLLLLPLLVCNKAQQSPVAFAGRLLWLQMCCNRSAKLIVIEI